MKNEVLSCDSPSFSIFIYFASYVSFIFHLLLPLCNGFPYRIRNTALSIPLIFFTTQFSWPIFFSFLGSPIFTYKDREEGKENKSSLRSYILLLLTISFLEIDKSLTLDLKVQECSLLVLLVFEPILPSTFCWHYKLGYLVLKIGMGSLFIRV